MEAMAGKVPDFAYPATVSNNSRKLLNKDLHERNYKNAIREALNLSIAEALISNSSTDKNVYLIDSISGLMPQPWSAVAQVIKADILAQYHNNDSYRLSERTLSLEFPWPENISEWSGAMFADTVFNTLYSVYDCIEKSKTDFNIPISELSGLLDIQDNDCDWLDHVTVADYLELKGASILSGLGRKYREPIIPFFGSEGDANQSPYENCYELALQLYKTLSEKGKDAGNSIVEALALRGEYGLENTKGQQKLLQIMLNLRDKEGFAIVSSLLQQNISDENERRELYQSGEAWLKRFPSSKLKNSIETMLKLLSEESINLEIPSLIVPGTEVKCKATLSNIKSAYALIYSVNREAINQYGSFVIDKFITNTAPGYTIPLSVDGNIPFSQETCFILPSLPEGFYLILPSKRERPTADLKKELETTNYSIINMSSLALMTLNDPSKENSKYIYAVDSRNQQPLEGVELILTQGYSRNKKTIKGKTDKDGSFIVKDGNYSIEALRDKSRAFLNSYFYTHTVKDSHLNLNLFTDCSVYHPGDTVKFAIIAWSKDRNNNSSPAASRLLTVKLNNSNYQEKGRLTALTDNAGRISGSFVIPADGLLGRYSIEAGEERAVERDLRGEDAVEAINDIAEEDVMFNSRCYFEVAEFKVPTFYVKVERDTVASIGDTIAFKGEVRTFSGQPLAGSEIFYRVDYSPWWRWNAMGVRGTYSGNLVADGTGSFEIKLPTCNLYGTQYEQGSFVLNVSALSTNGEREEAPAITFALGEQFVVEPSVPEIILVASDEVINLNVAVKNAMGFPVKKEVVYSILDADKDTVMQGKFVSPCLNIEAGSLPSGKYEFIFSVDGSSDITSREAIIFRKTDNTAPYKTPLWLPQTEFIAEEDEEYVDITVGSAFQDSWLYYAVKENDRLIKSAWLKVNGSNETVRVPAPKEYDKIEAIFSGMHDFESKTQRVSIISRSSLKKLDVETISFRDRVASGGRESWKFKFSIDSMPVNNVYAMAVMTDKALNSIAPFRWYFAPVIAGSYSSLALNRQYLFNMNIYRSFLNGKFPSFIYYNLPSWQTYGYALTGGYFYRDRVMFKQMSSSSRASVTDDSGSMNTTMQTSGMTNSETAESVMEEESADSDFSALDKDIQLRPIEYPIVFFKPNLETDDNGNLEIEFDVPDFNTTWQFQLLGYTDKMLSNVSVFDVIASKPVMIRGNLPLYLSTGDRAYLTAMVFNNSDSVISPVGVISVINPNTGTTICEKRFEDLRIEPSGNRLIGVDFEVPDSLSCIEVKSYVTAGMFTDGERAIIPVYPSTAPVYESVQFYIGENSEYYSLEVPNLPQNANVTLKYCNNPLQECLLSLQPLSIPDSKTSLSISKALYAAIASTDIIDNNQNIGEALVKLYSTEEYKKLKSRLEVDNELKVVGLNNTPWVNNAANERDRMLRLGVLLDSTYVATSKDFLTSSLLDLQNSDGGWSWCEKMPSSQFVTSKIICELGEINRIGKLSNELQKSVKMAMDFCDDRILRDYERHKIISISTLLDYLYAKSFFTGISSKSNEFEKLKKKALSLILKEWKTLSISDKAKTAILFNRTAGYERHAKSVLASLNEFALKDEQRGWWFDNLSSDNRGLEKLLSTSLVLKAYAEIEPGSKAINGLRQWLLLQKETEDWGTRELTALIVQAILDSDASGLTDYTLPEISLDARLIEGINQNIQGYITLNVNPQEISGKTLTIKKSGAKPAWGGIISQYISPIDEVRDVSSQNLKISRQLLRINGDKVSPVTVDTELNVGDKVRITISLTCDKDMDYVTLVDRRGAFLVPDEWLSGYARCGNLWGYREMRDDRTSMFFEFLPKGTHVITYDCYVNREGVYSAGMATVQSLYSPLNVAHSGGIIVEVNK